MKQGWLPVLIIINDEWPIQPQSNQSMDNLGKVTNSFWSKKGDFQHRICQTKTILCPPYLKKKLGEMERIYFAFLS